MKTKYNSQTFENKQLECVLCEKIEEYSKATSQRYRQLSLFDNSFVEVNAGMLYLMFI